MGKWQKIILKTLEQHRSFYLIDLLARPYSLSNYNALTRACRTLARAGLVRSYRLGGELVVARTHTCTATPDRLEASEKVKSGRLGFAEKLALQFGVCPRTVFKSVTFKEALNTISDAVSISVDELAAKRTLSQKAAMAAVYLLSIYPEATARAIQEAYQQRERIWRCRDLFYRMVRHLA